MIIICLYPRLKESDPKYIFAWTGDILFKDKPKTHGIHGIRSRTVVVERNDSGLTPGADCFTTAIET